MDHAVKIWQLPPLVSDDPDKGLMIRREDKPLFSSTRVHTAQVLSISWYDAVFSLYCSSSSWPFNLSRISSDILLSHSGPVVMRQKLGEKDENSLYPIKLWREPGTIVLWRWLGLDRYFPPAMTKADRLRGCASVSCISSYTAHRRYKLH